MPRILTHDDLVEISTATRETLGTAIEENKIYRLGKALVGGGVEVFVPRPERPGMVWITPIGDQVGDALPALNVDLPPDALVFGTYVEVERSRGYYRVVRMAPENAVYSGGTAPGDSNDGFLVNASQIDIALMRPTDPPTMRVIISAAYRLYRGQLYRQPARDSASMSTYVPTSGAVAIFVEVEIANNRLHYTASDSFDDTLNLRDAFASLPREVADGRAPLGYIRLAAGQTRITRSDILVVNGLISSGDSDITSKTLVSITGALIVTCDLVPVIQE
ncbi:MAG: hypothetical protein OHK0046_46110 [Anaerolineae bacterium]